MSFNSDVKHELCGCEIRGNTAEALRYGLFYGFRGTGPHFLTYDKEIVLYVRRVLPANMIKYEELDPSGNIRYCVTADSNAVSSEYGSFDEGIRTDKAVGDDETVGAFLRGVFMTCGNVFVQKAGYHLEFMPGSIRKCRALCTLINEQGMRADISHRGKDDIIYCKNSENISDILTFIGAMQSAMEIMNIKIMKEVRSGINRSVNCETANIGRTAKASAKQLEDIRLIFASVEKNVLTDELRELAQLRLDNPDMSLRDLGALLSQPLSRSGVNHRFERLSQIADELRNEHRDEIEKM